MQPRDPPDWEFHNCIKFVPPVSIVGETFEVDHQNLRQGPQVKLLCGLLMLLTVGTVPEKRNLHLVGRQGASATWALKHGGNPITSFLVLSMTASGQGGL